MSRHAVELRVRLPLAHFDLDVDVTTSARSLGVFGASGAGKTSLLEAIAGWRTPRAGRIRIGDVVLFDAGLAGAVPIEERGVGYVPQDALLFPHWDVARNVAAGRGRRGVDVDRDWMDRTVSVLEIEHLMSRSPATLSGGERQRVALARALASHPRILLLDEPLGSLDLSLRRRILPYLIRVRDEFGLPTILVSHDATEVMALCEETIVLERGRVRAQGSPREVLRRIDPHVGSFENVLTGSITEEVDGTARVRLDDGGVVWVPRPGGGVGARVTLAIGAEEILIALDAPSRISARNVLAARIECVEGAPAGLTRIDARVGGTGARLTAGLTSASVRELELEPGRPVFLVFKANSCQVLSRPGS